MGADRVGGIAIGIMLVVSILSYGNVGNAQEEEAVKKDVDVQMSVKKDVDVQMSEFKYKDLQGEEASPSVGSQVIIESPITNKQNKEQPFVYIVQIKNDDGVVESLSWITGELAAGQTLKVGQSWIPEEEITYTVEAFLWDDIVTPFPLASSHGDILSPPSDRKGQCERFADHMRCDKNGMTELTLGLPRLVQDGNNWVPVTVTYDGVIQVNSGLVCGEFDENKITLLEPGCDPNKAVSEQWILKYNGTEIKQTRSSKEVRCDNKIVTQGKNKTCNSARVDLTYTTASGSIEITYLFRPGMPVKTSERFDTTEFGSYTFVHRQTLEADRLLLNNGTVVSIGNTAITLSKSDYGDSLMESRFFNGVPSDNAFVILKGYPEEAYEDFQNRTIGTGPVVTVEDSFGTFRGSFQLDPYEEMIPEPSPDGHVKKNSGAQSNSTSCSPANPTYSTDIGLDLLKVSVPKQAVSGNCMRIWLEYDIPAWVPSSASIQSVTLQFDVQNAGTSERNCDYKSLVTGTQPEYMLPVDLWNAIENGVVYVDNNDKCKTSTSGGDTNPKDLVIGDTETSQATMDLDNAIAAGQTWFAVGIMLESEVRDTTSAHTDTLRSEEFCIQRPGNSYCLDGTAIKPHLVFIYN